MTLYNTFKASRKAHDPNSKGKFLNIYCVYNKSIFKGLKVSDSVFNSKGFSPNTVYRGDDAIYLCLNSRKAKVKPSNMDKPDDLYYVSRSATCHVMSLVRSTKFTQVHVHNMSISHIRDFILGVEEYDFRVVRGFYKTKPKSYPIDFSFSINSMVPSGDLVDPDCEKTDFEKIGFKKILSIASSVNIAKYVTDQPANVCTVDKFIKDIQQHTNDKSKITIKRIDDLKREGFGCLVGVGQGAAQEPALVVVEHRPRPEAPIDIAMVGKGIVFDTGGLSIKPSYYMYGMHTDMGGAATVLGAQADLINSDVNFLAVYALAENAVSANSVRPGDILTSLSGLTVEIKDTDAEGRLVLCDALTYVQDNYDCHVVLDIATLTGSAAYVGNERYSAVFSNNWLLTYRWLTAGTRRAEPAWAYPLMQDTKSALKSDRADLANCSLRGKAGHVVAAVYLQQFIKPRQRWIHIDCAGSATNTRELATGVPVQSLIRFAGVVKNLRRLKTDSSSITRFLKHSYTI